MHLPAFILVYLLTLVMTCFTDLGLNNYSNPNTLPLTTNIRPSCPLLLQLVRTTSTRWPFWRWFNYLHRSWAWTSNALFFFGVSRDQWQSLLTLLVHHLLYIMHRTMLHSFTWSVVQFKDHKAVIHSTSQVLT